MSVDRTPGWNERSEAIARQMRLDTELARLTRPGITNAEIAEQLPEDLRSLFWRQELNAFFAAELAQP